MKDSIFDYEVQGIGKSGRLYNQAEMDRANAAGPDDPEALAWAEDMRATTASDAERVMQQAVHDCPDCRAARARGEQPIVTGGHPFVMTGEQMTRNLADVVAASMFRARPKRKR